MKVRILSVADIRRLLTYQACIAVVREAMVEVSRRNVSLPLRTGMPLPNRKGMFGVMYGYLGKPESFGIKLVSLYPGNPAAGYSSHMGLVILYEPEHGRPVAIMDGSVVTAIRTAAASAVATDVLARKNAAVLAIIGTGEQAESHLDAIRAVRDIREVRVYGRTREKADKFIGHHAARCQARMKACATVDEAVAGADIICTVTSSPQPVLFGRQVEAGAHLNVVGSSFPDRAEIDTALVAKSRFYIDYRESTLAQAGEFLKAKAEGVVDDSHIVAEIGEVIAGDKPGRRDDREITLYKSLGISAQDLASAVYVWREAEKLSLGTVVDM